MKNKNNNRLAIIALLALVCALSVWKPAIVVGAILAGIVATLAVVVFSFACLFTNGGN